MSFARIFCLLALFALLGGCGDNLAPSGDDKRPPSDGGTVGPNVGQQAADFVVNDITSTAVTLGSSLAGRKAAVFYFTMWCPVCDTHMANMREHLPAYPDVGFFLVDYVSGSVTSAHDAAAASGYAGGGFTVLADTGHQLLDNFAATMGTTVVVDKGGIIRMNEDYRDGKNLRALLDALPAPLSQGGTP
jgi:peroxiredoxin